MAKRYDMGFARTAARKPRQKTHKVGSNRAPFYRWRNRGSEKLRNFSKVTGLVHGGARIQSQLGLTLESELWTSVRIVRGYRGLCGKDCGDHFVMLSAGMTGDKVAHRLCICRLWH